jgi:hypothetical protein
MRWRGLLVAKSSQLREGMDPMATINQHGSLRRRITWIAPVLPVVFLVVQAIEQDSDLLGLTLGIAVLVSCALAAVLPHDLLQERHVMWSVAALAFILAFSTSEAIWEREFYAVIAQIVPTIFLALTVTISALKIKLKNAEERFLVALVIAALIIAEGSSLWVLAGLPPQEMDARFTLGALAVAGVLVSFHILVHDKAPTQ